MEWSKEKGQTDKQRSTIEGQTMQWSKEKG
jgi:hypothetical protein